MTKTFEEVFKAAYKEQTMKPGTEIPSSTGGTITYTKTGLIHKAGKAYSGKAAEAEAKAKAKK